MYSNTSIYREYLSECNKINTDKYYKKDFFIKASNIIDGTNVDIDSTLINGDKSFGLEILKLNKSLSKREADLLQHHIFSQNFLEGRHFMNSLRDFINSTYSYLDMTSFKYVKNKNMLEFYGGNKELDLSNIYIDEFTSSDIKDYHNEIQSISDEKGGTIHRNLSNLNIKDNNTYGGIMSFKLMLPWGDDIIVSIKIKETLIDINKDILESQINRLEVVFNNSLLMRLSNLLLSNINSTYKDGMTGLYNKAYMEMITQSKRFSILVIDIDNFKSINDSYGHNAGDKVIKKVGSLLRKTTKGNDKICRTGGDEFVILVPTNSSKSLDIIIDRIGKEADELLKFNFLNNCKDCEKNCNKCIATPNKTELKVSISIGKKVMEGRKTVQEMLHDADMDMYSKKTDEGKMYRVLNQIEGIEDNDLLIEIYHELFGKILKVGGKKFMEGGDVLKIFETRIKQLNDKVLLEELIKLTSEKLRYNTENN